MSIAILQFFEKFYTKEVIMNTIPKDMCFEGFYIWFDINSKEEYYSTPLYMYKTDFNDDLFIPSKNTFFKVLIS